MKNLNLENFLTKQQRMGLILQALLVVVGLLGVIYSVYTIYKNNPLFLLLPVLFSLMVYIFIIYYSISGYKKGIKYYKIALYLFIITLILSIIPMGVYQSLFGGLILFIQVILLLYFIKNIGNSEIAGKIINCVIVFGIIILSCFHGVESLSNCFRYGFPPLIAESTFALIYHLRIKAMEYIK